VRDNFFINGENDPNAYATTFPNQTPLTIFFNPNNFDTSAYGVNLSNMGTVFHEGIHGFMGISDPDLQKALGCTITNPPFIRSLYITDYVKQFLSVPPIEPGNIRPCD
jgi:hypothetical protein